MTFKPEKYLDLKDFKYKDIFAGVNNSWEVLPKISDYILKDLKSIPVKQRLQGRIHSSAVIGEDIYVAKTAIVHPCAHIQGPALIDEDVVIGHAAFIRPNSIIGQKSVIGHCSEVKNSVLIKRVWASHFAYVGDSVLGTNIELGAGVKLANTRLDEKNVFVKSGQTSKKKISTDLAKFGCLIGDYSSLGCNSVTNPGTVIGKKSQVFPLTSVYGTHPSKSIIH